MGKKGLLAMVEPDEFRVRTSVVGRRNGPITLVDAAYADYYKYRSEEKAKKLYEALTNYLVGHGGYWAKIPRDKESGGLLRWLHDFTKPLGALAPEHIRRAITALNTYDIPHSRFGVLYLFANIEIDVNRWSIALEGVSEVGGAIGTGDTADYLGPVVSLASHATNINGTQMRLKPVARPKLPGFPKTSELFNSIAGDPTALLNPISLDVTLAGCLVYDLFNNLRVLLINAVTDLFNWIKSKMLTDGEFAWDISGQMISKAIRFVVGKCLESAAPFISGGMDLGAGIIKTFEATKERLGAYLMRREISLVPGHPEEAANAIESNMTQGIFAGLWSVLKGVASLALSSLLPGASSLVAALVTGVEWLVKFIWRIWEQSKIKKFLEIARKHYQEEKKLAELNAKSIRLANLGELGLTGSSEQLVPEMDRSKGGIIHDLDRFRAFYKKGCDASPLIPMLTLNTGICGSLTVLMRMFDDADNIITQETYNTGSEYFTKLKQNGRSYLAQAGFEFRPLVKPNASIQGLLNHAVRNHTELATGWDKASALGAGIFS